LSQDEDVVRGITGECGYSIGFSGRAEPAGEQPSQGAPEGQPQGVKTLTHPVPLHLGQRSAFCCTSGTATSSFWVTCVFWVGTAINGSLSATEAARLPVDSFCPPWQSPHFDGVTLWMFIRAGKVMLVTKSRESIQEMLKQPERSPQPYFLYFNRTSRY
jgi:hypothetical protein